MSKQSKPPQIISWLLRKRPPIRCASPELAVWWAVTRQAARDLVFSYESDALDALEYLRGTGRWVCTELFGVPMSIYETAVVELVRLREKRLDQRFPIELLRGNDVQA